MAAHDIILYDLATKAPCKCFSPNCWKTRATLNFKGLAYKTTWLEWPDVKATLAAFGIKPNAPEDNFLEYTCPTVKLPGGTYVMDSASIAPILERLQPEPSLHLDISPHKRVSGALGRLFGPLMPALLYKVRDGLTPYSAAYYESSRRPIFGTDLDSLAKSEAALNAWTNADAGISEVGAMLREKPDGPYVLGDVACYADVVLAAGWHCFAILDQPTWERLCERDAMFGRHYEACRDWFIRDRH